MVSPNFESIPDYLKSHARICLWRYEERTKGEGDWTKVPYNPLTGRRAKSNDPSTFTDYETARSILVESDSYDGLGAGVFDGLSAIDIDHCVKDGELSPMAREIVEAMDTYTEVSPSGEGLHLFFLAPGYEYDDAVYYINSGAAGDKAKAAYPDEGYTGGEGLEVYVYGATKKYLTITGNAINGNGVEDRGDVLPAILERFMRRDRKPANGDNGGNEKKRGFQQTWPDRMPSSSQSTHGAPRTPDDLTDDELLDAIRESSKAGEFFALWNGDTSAYATVGKNGHVNDGHSEADLTLCNYLAFWTGCNASRMDSLFRQSGLMRDKWDERRGGDTYGGMTISKAIADCRETYTPPKGGPVSDDDHGAEIREGEDDAKSGYRNELVNMETYLKAGGSWDAERARRYNLGELSTGYEYLDSLLGGGLYPDLYVLGGAPGCGKTTLALSIADNVAAIGWPVLYICTEQTQYELAAKSINRIAHGMEHDRDMSKLNSLSIIKGYWPEVARAAADEYVRRGTPTILSCEFDATIEGITRDVDAYEMNLKASGETRPPFIVLDYLQLLRSEMSSNSEREITDAKLRALKAMQRENDEHGARIVMCISSFGRDFYKESGGRVDTQVKPPTMGAWKESGNVEYTAAVCLALWRWAGNKDYEADEPGAVRCNCLKNRYGRTSNTFFYMDFQKDTAHNKKYQEMIDEGLINRPKVKA